MVFYVALAIFWRMRGEVQQSGSVVPGRERYGSGLRDRSANFQRSWKLTSIAALAALLAASPQSASARAAPDPSLRAVAVP
jgi:hypothetical protein